jgi:SAM-dependent methyltransferase
MRRPDFIAKQSAFARGFLGRLIARIMARETYADNARAVELLGISAGDRVIDIGCGPGAMLELIARQNPDAKIVGIDPSPAMIQVATGRNAQAIGSGQTRILQAKVEDVPGQVGQFDKALCAHVIYFWNDLETRLDAIGSLLESRGKLSILYNPKGAAKTESFPDSIYTFYETDELQAALDRAGFSVISFEELRENGPVVLIAERT